MRNSETTFKPGATQSVGFTGTAGTITNPVAQGTRVVRVYTTSDAFIRISADGSAATTSDMPLPGGTAEYFQITGNIGKVSAVQISASGTLYVTEMTH